MIEAKMNSIGMHDCCDIEEFLKSTNSAMSDYNFLFENID